MRKWNHGKVPISIYGTSMGMISSYKVRACQILRQTHIVDINDIPRDPFVAKVHHKSFTQFQPRCYELKF